MSPIKHCIPLKLVFVFLIGCGLIFTQSVKPANAGKKWRSFAIGAAVGAGAYALSKALKNKQNRKKRYSNTSNRTSGLSRARVQEIQAALNARGFNAGRPDGVMGRGTRAAIRQFQTSIGGAASGRLTPGQVNLLLGGGTAVAATGQSMTRSFANGCSNPMSSDQLQQVIAKFRAMTPGGDGFKIDRCRNITIRYGDKRKTGKLHQLFTELNSSHHDTTYYGLISKGEWWVYGSGGQIYLADQNKASKQMSSDWMMRYNRETVELLKMAGYESDPNAAKRQEILKRDFEALGRRDFGENLRMLGAIMRKYGGNGSSSGGSKANSANLTKGSGGASDGQSCENNKYYKAGLNYHCRIPCEDYANQASGDSKIIDWYFRASSNKEARDCSQTHGKSICRSIGPKVHFSPGNLRINCS